MYLLDTDVCIYLIKKRYPHLQKRITREKPHSIAISTITIAELEYGIAKSSQPHQNRENLLAFTAPFELIPFTSFDCETYGVIRAYLDRRGTPIGPYDLQIAAQCISRSLCLITHNTKEFTRVPRLVMEDWIEEH